MLHIHEEAEREFIESAEFIADDNYSASEEFIDAVEKGLREIEQFPNCYARYGKYYHVKVIEKFRHSIFYRIRGEGVYALAIYHHSRKPNRWKKKRYTGLTQTTVHISANSVHRTKARSFRAFNSVSSAISEAIVL